MANKTCGECRYYEHPAGQCSKVIEYNNCHITDKACEYFEPKPTNGDVIRQGGNRALAEFAYMSLRICRMCAFSQLEEGRYECTAERGQSCIDGIEVWLNAPAESEGEDE